MRIRMCAMKQYAATIRMDIVVVKLRLQMEEPANVGRHNPHTDTVELQGIIHIRVLVTIITVEILMGNQVVFGATQQILTCVGNIVTHCQKLVTVMVTLNPILLGGLTMSHLLRLRSRLLRGAVVLFRMMRA